jgi:hypothetical protein
MSDDGEDLSDGDDLSTPPNATVNPNRIRPAGVDFTLGRSPISSTSRSTPRSNFVPLAPDQHSIRGREGLQTDIRSSNSVEKMSSLFDVESGQARTGDIGEGEQFDRLLSRLKAV